MVDRLFQYLYALKYDASEPGHPDNGASVMLIHAKVYMIADKYDVPDLKQHAVSCFKKSSGT